MVNLDTHGLSRSSITPGTSLLGLGMCHYSPQIVLGSMGMVPVAGQTRYEAHIDGWGGGAKHFTVRFG